MHVEDDHIAEHGCQCVQLGIIGEVLKASAVISRTHAQPDTYQREALVLYIAVSGQYALSVMQYIKARR